MYKKVSVVALLLLLAISISFADVDIQRSMESTAIEGDLITVTLTITADSRSEILDIVEFTPKDWIVTGWDIEGYAKNNVDYDTKTQFYEGVDRTNNHWNFNTPIFGEIKLTYNVIARQGGSHQFLTVWTFTGGFDREVTSISIVPALGLEEGVPETGYCGDEICGSLESPTTCPKDCGRQPAPVVAPISKVPGISIDLTTVILAILVFSFAIAALIVFGKTREHIAEIKAKIEAEKEFEFKQKELKRVDIEDLRAFIKFGLRRGYTIRQMANALKGSKIDTGDFQKVAREEMRKTIGKIPEAKKKKMVKDDAYVKKLRKAIEKLRYPKSKL